MKYRWAEMEAGFLPPVYNLQGFGHAKACRDSGRRRKIEIVFGGKCGGWVYRMIRRVQLP
ncbi:MAG: hypothetical protein ACYSUY_03680 [Planctomycetota bacterium]